MKRWVLSSILILFVAACNQNIERISDGPRLEDSSRPEVPRASPLGMPELSVEGEEDDAPPFVKAYFMHTWVEALYSTPTNRNPNPDWNSPLIDPVDDRVWCTDCHVSGQVNFANIPKQRVPLVTEYEEDLDFMADLMRRWVGRLNSDEFGASAKLTGTVTCLTCHETNPAP